MSKRTDYYSVLGVERNVSKDQLKRAYRRLAKKFHPDRNPDDPSAERKFKEVQKAYDVLSDEGKRSEYDQFGEAGVGQWATNPRGQRVYQWGADSSIDGDDLESLFGAFGGQRGGAAGPSIFDSLFGGSQRRRQAAPERGRDAERRISLSFEQSLHGAIVTASIGGGNRGQAETLEVKIPAGVKDGQRIRLAGRGHPGRHGGPAGDFFLVCSVAPHPHLTRRDADLYLDVPVSVSEAALGARVDVPTPDGRATVTIPPGTASGAKLRLAGHGMPKPGGGGRGDQYVVVTIVPPESLTDEHRALFETLRDEHAYNPRSGCSWNVSG